MILYGYKGRKELDSGKMSKFRRKPIIVEALQYTGDNKKEIVEFTKGDALTNSIYGHLIIEKGDWIIKSMNDKFYICKPDVFEQMYEYVSE